MDEGTLNDLLECSVCLERLDTTSKVLPCQHTFCRKCLEEILQKHKELRCPECRVLVTVKIDSLPPNILLMRLLEGMKGGQGPKRVPPRQVRNVAHVHQVVSQQQQNVIEQRVNNKHPGGVVISHQPYAKALYDYAPKEVGDLCFKRGDIIILKKRIDSHWYQGECKGVTGVFPLSYVQVITPVPSHSPQCKALYDFRMTNDEEEGCLSFSKGDIINVIRRVDENWAEGRIGLDGRIGIFPLAFVEMNSLARSLMKLSTNVQPGPSKVAPPTPTSEDSTPLIPTDHTATCISQPNTVISDSSSSTTTPNVSSSNTSSGSSTEASSPASPPTRTGPVSPKPRKREIKNSVQSGEAQPGESRSHSKEKRHSLIAIGTPQQNAIHRHSAEIPSNPGAHLSSASSHRSERSSKSGRSTKEITLPAECMALYPYKPQKPDEMELKKGTVYTVTEICQDGWYKGVSKQNQKSGVFPGNYVVLAKTTPHSASSNGSTPDSKLPVSFTRCHKPSSNRNGALVPPELPPRSTSPAPNVSSSWHGSSAPAGHALGRSSSATMTASANSQQLTLTKSEKPKDKRDKGSTGVSLMRRLASMKRSKSPPPPSSYSMDNPVFEDVTSSASPTSSEHPVHVRSGSCPSQLLQIQPSDHRLFGSTSQRIKHKERPSIQNYSARSMDNTIGSSNSSPDMHRHKKSNSLDASNKSPKTGVQTVRERFRCIAPYPPNSEYELELQVNDIIYVHKKRDDGWYKGTQQRTGKTGLFPASFVESF